MQRNFARCLEVCLLLATFLSVSGAQQKPDADPWKPLQFLMGRWIGVGTGSPGEGKGYFMFSPALDGKVVVRTNHTEYPPKPGEKKGSIHDDLLTIYHDQGSSGTRAIYFDNEGHVIHYTVTNPVPDSMVVFETDPSDGAAQFKLIYAQLPGGMLNIEFFVAPPGREMKLYLQGTAKRES